VLKGILVDDAEGEVKKCHQMSQTGCQANSHRKQQSKRNVEFSVVKDLKQVYKASVSTINYYIYFA